MGGTALSGAGAAGITLTDAFDLTVAGRRVSVPHSAERVLAYLALSERPVRRAKLAGSLWIDVPERLAAKCLRTTLWRLNLEAGPLVRASDDRLMLLEDVNVDLRELMRITRDLIDGPNDDSLAMVPALIRHQELLPDWDDEWVVADRERFRLVRLEALECAAEWLLDRQALSRALEAALAVSLSEPLRESSRRLIVRIRLAQGNVAEAVRVYRAYRDLLDEELGIEPTQTMDTLVRPHLAV